MCVCVCVCVSTVAAIAAFPAPVEVPSHVDEVRDRRLANLRRLVLVGLAVRGAIVAAELAAWWVLGSQALLVDAVASGLDIVSSFALLAAVLLATRPPDDDHPFGHGRYEPLAGLQLGLLIAVTGGWLAVTSWRDDRGAEAVPAWLFAVPLVAAVVLAAAGVWMRRAAGRWRSSALRAEANHYLVDAATSLVAAGGLLAAGLAPEWSAAFDSAAAAALALVMIALGAAAAWENVHQIVDRTPEPEFFDRVRVAALAVDGVRDVEKVRIQVAGPDAHVDIDIEVDPAMTVAASHVIAQHVRAAIQTDWPQVREVVVHVEPWFADDH